MPPGGHLPGGVGALAEHEVGDEHPERSHGEARKRAERVADDERDRGDRLDVRQRDERVASERGERGEDGDDRDHARGRARCARTRAIRRRARARRSGTRRAASSRDHLNDSRAGSGSRTDRSPRGASTSAPCSGSSAPPAPPRMRAVSVAKYHPPASSSAVGPSAITRPSASSTARSAQAAANSGSCVATMTASPCSERRCSSCGELSLGGAVHARAWAHPARAPPAARRP